MAPLSPADESRLRPLERCLYAALSDRANAERHVSIDFSRSAFRLASDATCYGCDPFFVVCDIVFVDKQCPPLRLHFGVAPASVNAFVGIDLAGKFSSFHAWSLSRSEFGSDAAFAARVVLFVDQWFSGAVLVRVWHVRNRAVQWAAYQGDRQIALARAPFWWRLGHHELTELRCRPTDDNLVPSVPTPHL